MGNPLSYRDRMKMSWQCGRELASVTIDSSKISYSYNVDGLRRRKTAAAQSQITITMKIII